MPEEVHITQIEKVGTGDVHAMHIRGVVDGHPVDGLVPVDTFERQERQGKDALAEALKDGLASIHEEARSRRR